MTIIDTTEYVGPLPVGFTEPAEQTGSDDETQAVTVEPLEKRIYTPRIYKGSNGRWYCADSITKPGRFHLSTSGLWITMKSHDTFTEALATLRAESIKDLGFVPDAKVQVIGNAFPSMDNERGVDYRGATGRVVKVDLDMKLPIEVELDHFGYSQMFDVAELEVIPA